MGQTLTHGVYLPDEGERNCYDGLAANWSILDGAVGTIAEHTTQITGKANAVHTHSKSDITDLFNSANVWTDSQTFADINRQFPSAEKGVTPSSNNSRYEYINDKNGVNLGYCQFSYNTAGNLSYSLRLENLYDNNNQLSPNGSTKYAYTALVVMSDGTPYYRIYGNTIPNNTNRFDLGNSSNQWNNLYAKNYYYNGVAWGLDKSNTWTGTNTFQQNITYERTNFFHQVVNPSYILKDTGLEKGSLVPTAHTAYPGLWHDKNSAILGYMRFVAYDTGKQTAEIRVSNLIKNGALNSTGSIVNCTVNLELQPSGEKSLIPEQNNDINLGTSTNRWKSLNGINPGALSLPDMSSGTGVSLSAGSNSYSPPSSGWLSINLTGAISVVCGNFCHSGTDMLSVPVVKGSTYTVTVATSGTAYLFVSQGNV